MPAPTTDRSILAPPSPHSPRPETLEALHLRFDSIEQTSGARSIAVAVYDTETQLTFRRHADRWFHAASTIKVAILLGVYASIHHGWLRPQSRLHVRNRFRSAVDGHPFRVAADRDANAQVHTSVGKMMRVTDLALHMIATSSNLATNLLLDLVGLETVQRALVLHPAPNVDAVQVQLVERAFERGINNRVTADGLVQL